MRKITIIESPFADDVEANKLYAQRACLDAIGRNEIPFASHLFFTQFLDDTSNDDREFGITAGYGLAQSLDTHNRCQVLIAFYVDKGWSLGMERALEFYTQYEYQCVIRRLPVPDLK